MRSSSVRADKSMMEGDMNSKTLTGWILIVGPILTFLVVGILYDAVIGPGETNAEAVSEAMAKAQMATLLRIIGAIAFVSPFIGMTLFSRSMQGETSPGAPYAAIAGIVFTAISAIAILASGLSLGTIDTAKNSVSDAAIIEIISDGIFPGLFVFWGIGNILIGTAMVIQKNLHIVMGWLFVCWGAFMLIISVLESVEIPDAVGLILWAGLNLTMVTLGILTLKPKETS